MWLSSYLYSCTPIDNGCAVPEIVCVFWRHTGIVFFYWTSMWLIYNSITTFRCHDLESFTQAAIRILPNYIATYVPMAVVMIVNPILYLSTTRDVENVIARSLGQFTRKERTLVDAIKLKYCFIISVFYICWLPNIINGVLLWILWFSLPETVIIGLWYIMVSKFCF